MTVAHLYRVVQDAAGNVVPGAQVSLCDPGSTGALITDTLYADQQLTAVLSNLFTTPNGVIDVYLARPRTVTLKTLAGAVTLHVDYVDVAAPPLRTSWPTRPRSSSATTPSPGASCR